MIYAVVAVQKTDTFMMEALTNNTIYNILCCW